MKSDHLIPGGLALAIITSLLLVSVWFVSLAIGSQPKNLTVSFLDVGQGDSVLIETPTGSQVLVDGGSAGRANRPLSASLPVFDRTLNMVVATHADSDHIAGLVEVLKEYSVQHIVLPVFMSATQSSVAFENATKAEEFLGAKVHRLTSGTVLDLGGGVYMLVLFPGNKDFPADTNDSSLVAKLFYGDASLLLTGDISSGIETYLTDRFSKLLDSDVLKVAHHGSDTSSSEIFLAAVSPAQAIISAGADNSYGHPHQTVLDRLSVVGATTICTCDVGTIEFVSDGKEFTRVQ